MLLTTVCCSFTYGKIIYVDAEGTGANEGSSWANAYWCLRDALANVRSGDEIRVAQGIYKPDQQVVIVSRRGAQVVATGNRTATFQLRDGVTIRGGYAGFGKPDPDSRDVRLYETILSGDLNGNDGPGFANNAENSYHVVTGDGTDTRAVLDGFTVTGGNADDTYGYGGGMHNRLCRPTVISCTFSGNCATRGGGMANREYSSPAMLNCVFSSNQARWGGGMCNWTYSSTTLTNCTFSGNTAEDGGAMIITKSSEVTLRNCTLTGNWASAGVAGAINCSGNCTGTLVNTILWSNSPNEIDLQESSITVTYSDVQGTGLPWPGEGNINADPLFVDADGANDSIGTWNDDLRLLPGSPCIDAGDNSAVPPEVVTDLGGNPRIVNSIVDMGAYEVVTATNLGSTVNSHYWEASPSISADGLALFFDSDRPAGSGERDLYVTTRTTKDDDWGRPVNLGQLVNTPFYDGQPGISTDGCSLYFSSDRPGGFSNQDLWVTTRPTTNDQWATPVNLGSTVNSSAHDTEPSISADGLTLFFDSDRPGGYGSWDIWMVTRASTDGRWRIPVSLPPSVNSVFSDGEPSISADGRTLYFCSNRPGGYGTFDLWVATRETIDDEWGTPVNLGPIVNTTYHDWGPSISADGSTLYFTGEHIRNLFQNDYDLWQVSLLR